MSAIISVVQHLVRRIIVASALSYGNGMGLPGVMTGYAIIASVV